MGTASTFYLKELHLNTKMKLELCGMNILTLFQTYFKFDIDPNNLFDQIVFDPRMKKDKYLEQKKILKGWGYDKRIIQSSLYKIPNLKMNIRNTINTTFNKVFSLMLCTT
jgi:hypothetical protein